MTDDGLLWDAFHQYCDRRRIAIHEASHVITARELRVPVRAVTVRDTDLAQDGTHFGKTLLDGYRSPEDAVVAIAGTIGEQIAADQIGGEPSVGAHYDMAIVRSALAMSGAPAYDEADGRTLHLLLDLWDDVQRVATALLDRARLSSSESNAILGEE